MKGFSPFSLYGLQPLQSYVSIICCAALAYITIPQLMQQAVGITAADLYGQSLLLLSECQSKSRIHSCTTTTTTTASTYCKVSLDVEAVMEEGQAGLSIFRISHRCRRHPHSQQRTKSFKKRYKFMELTPFSGEGFKGKSTFYKKKFRTELFFKGGQVAL